MMSASARASNPSAASLMVVAITAEGCGCGMDVSFSLGTLGDSQLFRADRFGTSGPSRAAARGDGGTRPDDRARSEKFPAPAAIRRTTARARVTRHSRIAVLATNSSNSLRGTLFFDRRSPALAVGAQAHRTVQPHGGREYAVQNPRAA